MSKRTLVAGYFGFDQIADHAARGQIGDIQVGRDAGCEKTARRYC
jgi:hypothetical protein